MGLGLFVALASKTFLFTVAVLRLGEICVGFLVAYTGFMSQVKALSTPKPSFQSLTRPYVDHQGMRYALVLLLATKWDPWQISSDWLDVTQQNVSFFGIDHHDVFVRTTLGIICHMVHHNGAFRGPNQSIIGFAARKTLIITWSI